MSLGCRNPMAANYDPLATEEDYSCLYLEKDGQNCYLFEDVAPEDITDKSFTLSYSLEKGDFVFFHDYIPDMYFGARDRLFSLKDGKIYRHHQGAPGIYYSAAPRSFFVDVIFRSDQEMILNAVQWISEEVKVNGQILPTPCTHITLWNSKQCSGRIALVEATEGLEFDSRHTVGIWSFNAFRNQLLTNGVQFLKDIFNNFAVDPAAIDVDKPWFDQELLSDNWVAIRFEYDNTSGRPFIFHGSQVDASKSYR